MAGKAKKAAKRTESLVVRLTPQEVEKVQELASRGGKTVSEWIREKIHREDMPIQIYIPRTRTEIEEYQRLLNPPPDSFGKTSRKDPKGKRKGKEA